jgi:hypothetical protein
MFANSSDAFQSSRPNESPTRSQTGDADWHVWPVTIPRRSITGRLIWGLVMRRRVGRKWIYKKYTKPSN